MRQAKPSQDQVEERTETFVFTYREWKKLLDTGKFAFRLRDLILAKRRVNGFIGEHFGYRCYIGVEAPVTDVERALSSRPRPTQPQPPA